MKIKNQYPPEGKLLVLLNDSYGNWGDEKYLRWKYDRYPDYKPEHNYFIEEDGKLIAFTRMFYRELISKDDELSVITWGDTAVHEGYRGKGIYSKLKTTRTKSEDDNDVIMAFSKKGNIPYHVHLKDGWEHKELPKYLRILSPSKVFKVYTEPLFEGSRYLNLLVNIIGDKITLNFSDDSVRLSEFISKQSQEKDKIFDIEFRIRTKELGDMIQSFLENDHKNMVNTASKILVSCKIEDDIRDIRTNSFRDYETIVKNRLNKEDIKELKILYPKYLKSFDFYFRREQKDIEHILNCPRLVKIISLWKNNSMVGVAMIAESKRQDIQKYDVLDMAYIGQNEFEILTKEIEKLAIKEDADLISMISSNKPSDRWVPIRNGMAMWETFSEKKGLKKALKNSKWMISHYDVV